MLVYFKVKNIFCHDGKNVWKWFTFLDPHSDTFDYLVRQIIREGCKKFDGIDGYITESGPTVNGDWIVEFLVITNDMIKEETIDVRNSGAAH